MHTIIRHMTGLIVLFLLYPTSVHADESSKSKGSFSKMDVIKLVNGPNQVDLNGDGTKDLIFVA